MVCKSGPALPGKISRVLLFLRHFGKLHKKSGLLTGQLLIFACGSLLRFCQGADIMESVIKMKGNFSYDDF